MKWHILSYSKDDQELRKNVQKIRWINLITTHIRWCGSFLTIFTIFWINFIIKQTETEKGLKLLKELDELKKKSIIIFYIKMNSLATIWMLLYQGIFFYHTH